LAGAGPRRAGGWRCGSPAGGCPAAAGQCSRCCSCSRMPPFSPRQSPAQPPAEPLWGTLRVCATPGPHGGPWPALETEGHFVTRLANTACACWTCVCTNNLDQEVIEKGSFCQVGKTNHHANENDYIQTLSPTDLLPRNSYRYSYTWKVCLTYFSHP